MWSLFMVVLPIVLGAQALRLYETLGVSKVLGPTTPDGCFLVDRENNDPAGSIILPVEDLVHYRSGILLGGAGGVLLGERFSPESRPLGYIVAVDARGGGGSGSGNGSDKDDGVEDNGDNNTPVVRKLKMSKFPADTHFLPHGIYYSKASERLYVVNHAGVSSVGTRVEVFDVTRNGDDLPELTWRLAVGGKDLFANMALNAVVEGQGDEIYVTQWQSTAVPAGGGMHPKSISEIVGRIVHLGQTFMMMPGNQGVYRCTFDSKSPSNPATSCRRESWGYMAANGITATPDLSRIYVADPVAHKIFSYARDPADGTLDYLSNETISTPHAPDNVHYDEETGELHTGTIPRIVEFADLHARASGTFQVFSQSKPGSRYDTVEQRVVHDASLLDEFSACMPLAGPNKRWSVCGSPIADGLLVCPAS
ncbi:Serum paraoxonase/arylesterase 1 [Hondaea fermentalgiana]|uniref:Serum paraoxonase/arylesterase 1 n=1 Tax=Hondaea fermentalgiana TaxID=2315210 RepID=A0A2R5GSE3_9STRA|nr:Serum paraoxonase/arylesterase 1 [Hondaea fermentalgiana]|eukprot:GBG32678.1 Serum paraoxonase/arylesterase 1 [Hondaea fermentalgiana]